MKPVKMVRKTPPTYDAIMFDGTESSAKSVVEWVDQFEVANVGYNPEDNTIEVLQGLYLTIVPEHHWLVRPRGLYRDLFSVPYQDLVDDYYIIQD